MEKKKQTKSMTGAKVGGEGLGKMSAHMMSKGEMRRMHSQLMADHNQHGK